MAVCIIGLIAIGWYMVDLKPEEGKYDFYHWHKSFGMLLILLFPLRFALRQMTDIPTLPEGIKPQEKTLSRFVHISLYLLMISVPVIGYLMSSFGGYPVKLFMVEVPNMVGKDKSLAMLANEAHWISAYALLALVFLHISGVIKHRFFEPKEHDVLKRMI